MKKLIKKYIPGHFIAFTLWLVVLVVFMSIANGKYWLGSGFLIFTAGAFIGSQGTHIHQHHDSNLPTWLENFLLATQPTIVKAVGITIAGVGMYIASRQ